MIYYRNTEQERVADARLLLFFIQYDTIINDYGVLQANPHNRSLSA